MDNEEKNVIENLEEENLEEETLEEDKNDDENDYELDDNETFTYNANNNLNHYGSSNKSFFYIFIGIIVLVFIILLLVYFANRGSKEAATYSDIENRMVSAAKNYVSDNESLFDDKEVKVTALELVEKSYLRPFSEMLDGASCDGYVLISGVSDGYSYLPYLSCDDYTSIKLSDYLIDSTVSSGDGLYEYNDGYIYRGEYPNNYVSFDKKMWRIARVNADGSIKMFLVKSDYDRVSFDNRYNVDMKGNVGLNDFRVSRLLEYLTDVYSSHKYVSKKNTMYLVKANWCIGKMTEDNVPISSLNLCSDVYEGLYIGLLQVDDILIPSLDSNCVNVYDRSCTNYNYFSYIETGWTLNGSSDSTTNVFYGSVATIDYQYASRVAYARPTIVINGNVLYKKGDGTQGNPFVIGD